MRYLYIFFLLLSFLIGSIDATQAQIIRPYDDTQVMYEDAESLYKNRQYGQAILLYNQVVKKQPNNDIYLFGKGLCHIAMKDYEKAMFTLAKATKLRPDYAQGHYLLAKCYEKLGKTDKMVKSLEQASNYEDNEIKRFSYKMQIVEALMKTEKYSQALSQIVIAWSMQPENEQLLFYEGKVANQLKQYETARKRLEQATTKLRTTSNQKRASYYYELGYAYFHLGKTEKAQEAWKEAHYGKYKKLIARYNPQYFYHIASAYFEIYDYENAEKNLFNTLKLDKNYTQAYFMLAQIQERKAVVDAGLAYYRTALNQEDTPHKKIKMMSVVAKKMMEGQAYDQALEVIEDYTRLYPEERNMLFMKGLALHHLGEYEQAAQVLEGMIKSTAIDHKTKAKYHFLLAEIYKNANLPERAKLAYRSARYGTFYRAADEEYGKIVDLLTKK